MRKNIFAAVVIFFTVAVPVFSQSLSVNTDGSTANASAMLDVKSNVKGMLIPRMTRTERNAVISPATGLLIFQSGPDSIGFYYYNGTAWTWMLANSNTDSLAWRTGGNTGTTTNNFVGTTDNVPLILKSNNSEKLRITSNGEVGIGTSTPNSSYGYAKLEVASEGFGVPTDLLVRNAVSNPGYAPGIVFQHARGTLAVPLTVNNGDYLGALSTMNYDGSNYVLSAGLDIYADGVVSSNIVPTRLQFNTMNSLGSNSARLTIKSDGKIGIGTTAPGEKLEITGNLKFSGTDTIYAATGQNNMLIRPGDGTGSGGTLTIRGGNAGISTGGAGGDLTIQGGLNLPSGGAGYGGLGPTGKVNIYSGSGYNTTGGNINVIAGATSCWSLANGTHADVTIQGGQNYTVTDAASIVVEGGYVNGAGACASGNSTGGNLIFKSGIADGTGAQGNIQLLNGNVGIGTSAPSSKLEVCGNVRVIGTIVASGSITTSAISCPSDFRYKKNITPLINSTQKLIRLNAVNYYWKTAEFPDMNFNDKLQTGFIAQDLEKIFPEMVFTDDKGYKSIDYSRLTPVLVETIKEQQKQITDISNRLLQIEKMLNK